jgi:hypothetical protein
VQGIWFGEFPVPSSISVERCIQGDQWVDEEIHSFVSSQDASPPSLFPFSAKTYFDLPLSYDTLFLLARGPQSYGTVNIIASQSTSQVAKVYLTVNYFDRGIRDSGAKACLVKRTNNQLGIGIFVCVHTR